MGLAALDQLWVVFLRKYQSSTALYDVEHAENHPAVEFRFFVQNQVFVLFLVKVETQMVHDIEELCFAVQIYHRARNEVRCPRETDL